MKPAPDPPYRQPFPAEVTSHAVWIYYTFSQSLRDVGLLLAEWGISVSFETVRRWCAKFAESVDDDLRRRRPRAGRQMAPRRVLRPDPGGSALPVARASA
jgi:putative transposase